MGRRQKVSRENLSTDVEALLTRQEAAQLLHCSEDVLRRAQRDPRCRLKYYSNGKTPLYARADLLDWAQRKAQIITRRKQGR